MKLRIYNSTLEPNLWSENKTLKPEIRESLLKIAEEFYKSTDLTGDIHNILFLGSSANYNWNPKSDIDVHIIVDIAEEKINEEYARKFMDSLSFKWNTEHNIEIKGHPVEVYLQDIREPNSDAQKARKGAAIYSIFDDKWILEPERHSISLDSHKIKTKYQIIKKKIDKVIDSSDTDKLKELMTSIRNYRDAGLSKGGEFSVENLVFKCLRYSGYLKKLRSCIDSIYDKQHSLPKEGHVLPHKKTEPLEENSKPFLIVGTINDDLDVKAEIDYVGFIKGRGVNVGHPMDINNNPNVCWRYKSTDNAIYWRPDKDPTEQQKDAVKDWLHKKFTVVNPKDVMGIGIDYLKRPHQVNEILN